MKNRTVSRQHADYCQCGHHYYHDSKYLANYVWNERQSLNSPEKQPDNKSKNNDRDNKANPVHDMTSLGRLVRQWDRRRGNRSWGGK